MSVSAVAPLALPPVRADRGPGNEVLTRRRRWSAVVVRPSHPLGALLFYCRPCLRGSSPSRRGKTPPHVPSNLQCCTSFEIGCSISILSLSCVTCCLARSVVLVWLVSSCRRGCGARAAAGEPQRVQLSPPVHQDAGACLLCSVTAVCRFFSAVLLRAVATTQPSKSWRIKNPWFTYS